VHVIGFLLVLFKFHHILFCRTVIVCSCIINNHLYYLPMLSYDRPAGLDSMVLDINQLETASVSPSSLSSSALDGISYVMIPRVRRKGKGRAPLEDKTYEFNLVRCMRTSCPSLINCFYL
jgi:hypothetical protein